MPRDAGLEEMVLDALREVPGVSGKAMFGGWAFLVRGKLLCGVRRGSLMVRVGPENEAWALEMAGVEPVAMRGRRMRGYVRAGPEAYEKDEVRERLLSAGVAFVRGLKE